jgi:hypothetical protein
MDPSKDRYLSRLYRIFERGADDIAAFLYGDARHRRNVHNLVETKRAPRFRLGTTIRARKSALMAWIKCQKPLRAIHGGPSILMAN